MLPLRIISTGMALPGQVVSSAELDVRLKLSSGAVQKKSGIVSRHFALAGEVQSELAAQAVRHALSRAGLKTGDVDLLISVAGVVEQALPNMASMVAHHLGLNRVAAFDLNASCLGFLAGLQVAASMLASGMYRRIALVASDLASRGIDWDDPEASFIFGDGAAAVILERGTEQGIRAFRLQTYPEGRAYCEIRAGGTRRNPRVGVEPKDFLFRMDGKAVFRLASQTMPRLLDDVLHEAGISRPQVDVVVPHQASHLGMAHLIKRLELPRERVVNIYPTHGNQVAASIPTALHHAYEQGLAAQGKCALLLGTAAGFTAGAAVMSL